MNFEEQIMSSDKYPSIFSKSNGDYCVYYPLNTFGSRRSFENWGMFSNIRSRNAFRPIVRERKYLMDYCV